MEFMKNYAVYIFMAAIVGWMLWQRLIGPHLAGVKSISASGYLNMRNNPHTLVDVRSDGEWASGHAPKALHIPLGQIGTRKKEIPTDRPVILICASGNRSAMAATTLAKSGFGAVYNFSGGMGAWSGAGLPVKSGRK